MALLIGLVLQLILVCMVDRSPPGDERATDPVRLFSFFNIGLHMPLHFDFEESKKTKTQIVEKAQIVTKLDVTWV